MKRAFEAVGVLAAAIIVLSADLGACGDKSLSAGGIRWQRAQAARFPAAILIYGQPGSRVSDASRALKLQATLRQVGHKYREVTTPSELRTALESGQFNIVIADVGDVTDVQPRLAASPSHPVLVPIAYKLTKIATDEAAKQNRFLIKAPSRSAQYLETIADAVSSISKGARKG